MKSTTIARAAVLLLAALLAAEAVGQDGVVALRYARFDPIRGEPPMPVALTASPDAVLWIVQFTDRPTDGDRRAMQEKGAQVVSFLPHRAHVVRGGADIALSIRQMPQVRWVGSYHPAYRLEPELLAQVLTKEMPAASYNVIVADKRMDKATLAEAVAECGGQVVHAHPGSILLEVRLTGPQVLQVLHRKEVLWLDRLQPRAVDLDNARIQGGANYVETVGGYLGQGIRGHVYEGIQLAHPDFPTPPVVVQSCPTADDHGHATAGIVFGNGVSHPGARGIAPAMTPFFTNDLCVTPGFSRWQVVQELVNVHQVMFTTASWGNGLSTAYGSLSADADDIVFDHGIAWTQSQSNSGNQQSRPQAWAKNLFSVGGVRHYDNSDPSDDSWSGGASIGPAADGRIKPDFCSYYDSTLTSDRTGVDGYDPGDSYASFGGTSGATPIVAGHNALAIQMYTDGLFGPVRVPGGSRFQNRPNCTTLKALQIACASQYAFDAFSTDNRREHQGWGYPNLRTMYDDRQQIFVVDETAPLRQGQALRCRMQVGNGRPELRVAMTFNDPAANPAAALTRVNDLHLRAIAPDGTVYWGNHGLHEGTGSEAGGAADTVDTVECVFVVAPQPGVWSIDVIADLVVVDNHTATPAVDADFGLVVRGATHVGFGAVGTVVAFGNACAGSAPGAPDACLLRNDTAAKTSVAVRASATYALELVAPTTLEVVGFEIYANSTTGVPQLVPASIRLPGVNGEPSVVATTGSITLPSDPGWTAAAIAPVTLQAGQTFYVAFDTLATAPSVWDATSGGTDVPYFRLEAGVWSARLTARFEWCIRVLCRPTTTLSPRLHATGIMDVGHSFVAETRDALPSTWAVLLVGLSNQFLSGLPLPLELSAVGAPGCSFFTNEDLFLIGRTSDAGAFSMPCVVPLLPALVGMHVYEQAIVLDPYANTLGLAFSNGLDIHIGG